MKIKFLTGFITVVLVLICLTKSFAQPKETPDLPGISSFIRVGITSKNFGTSEYREKSFTSAGIILLEDKTGGEEILKSSSGDVIKFEIKDYVFNIYQNGNKIAEHLPGPFLLKPEKDFLVEIVGLTRKGKPAAYRGGFEIAQTPFYSCREKQNAEKENSVLKLLTADIFGENDGATKCEESEIEPDIKPSSKTHTGRFSVINIIPLEEYLRGVVPNELPVSFGLEALKAQSVAARNYAIRPRNKPYPLFDVCDSVQSQVYFGANTERTLSDKAVKETEGLTALYGGEPILALYASAAGGYTESYENAFSSPATEEFFATALPFLKGKPDIPGTPLLNTEEAARKFYTSVPPSFDVDSGYYRWTRTWTEPELRRELNRSMNKFSKSKLISPGFKKGENTGRIKRIEVLSRGVSGKIKELFISAENGSWSVRKELLIRRIMTNKGKALPSANAVFDNCIDKNGYLVKLEAFGGGFGHGVGMSQYGAGFMSKNGCTFDKILQHYYDGIAIGTRQLVIDRKNTSEPLIQTFYSSGGKADLIIENEQMIDKFIFEINSEKIKLNENYLPRGKIRMPLDNFIVKGLNEIVFYPLENNREKNIKVWVEVFKAKKTDDKKAVNQ